MHEPIGNGHRIGSKDDGEVVKGVKGVELLRDWDDQHLHVYVHSLVHRWSRRGSRSSVVWTRIPTCPTRTRGVEWGSSRVHSLKCSRASPSVVRPAPRTG